MLSHHFAVLLLTAVSASELPKVRGLANVIVKTKNGDICGQTLHTAPFITKVNQFLGIPFAAPPVGELRFQPTRPAQQWKPRIRNATRMGNFCMQIWYELMDNFMKALWPNVTEGNFDEDCLYLNVFAPAQNDSLNPTTKYPVMVHIHGGGFINGNAMFSSGLVLAQYGVVLVSIQYRLGALGFMTSGDSAAPGNYGILDQVQALKWIKENINSFGGDPNKVTIFGMSAGGVSVGLQLLSPLSKGLFHGAISESGVDLAPWSVLKKDKAVATTLRAARELGCNSSESTELMDCLRSKNARSFLNLRVMTEIKSGAALVLPWAPIADQSAGEDAFLPDHPHNLRQSGKFRKVPFMAGCTTNDGASFFAHLSNTIVDMAIFELEMKNYAMQDLHATRDKDLISLIKNALEFQYTPWGKTTVPTELRMSITDAFTDSWFVAPTVQSCMMHSALAPTYLFEFNYRSEFSFLPRWMGPTHGDNYIFDFGAPFLNLSGLPPYRATDKKVSDLVMRMYTNFAKFGNPTPEPLSNGVQWSAFNSTNLAYLRIQPEPAMKKNINPHRVAFWNVYHPQLLNSARACNTTDNNRVSDGVVENYPSFSMMFFLVSGTCLMLMQ